MKREREESSRRRMNRDAVRNNAKNAGQKKGMVSAPEGCRIWTPTKKGVFEFRFLPYEVTRENHPDGVAVGDLWYRRPYMIHNDVGGSGRNIICPQSVGKPCPICEQVKLLSKNYEKNSDTIKSIRGKDVVMYAVLDPQEPDTILIFDWSPFKFGDELEKELSEGEAENAGFADSEDGKLVKFRIISDSYMGREFLKCDRLDFVDAGDLTDVEETLLDRVPKLDELLLVPSYKQIEALFFGADSAGEEGEEGEEPKKPSKPTGKPSKPAPKKEAEEEESAGDSDAGDDWDEEPKKPSKPAGKPTSKPSKPAPKKEEEEEESGEGEEEDPTICKACSGSGKSSKGKKCVPCDGTGHVSPEEEEEEAGESESESGDDWDEEPKKPSKPSKPSKPAGKPSKPADDDEW